MGFLLINDDLDMVKLENKLGVPKKVNEFSSVCKDIFDFYRGEFSEKKPNEPNFKNRWIEKR